VAAIVDENKSTSGNRPAAKTGSPADPGSHSDTELYCSSSYIVYRGLAAHRGPQIWAEEWLENLEVLPAAKVERLNAATTKSEPIELLTDENIYPCSLINIVLYSDTKAEGKVLGFKELNSPTTVKPIFKPFRQMQRVSESEYPWDTMDR